MMIIAKTLLLTLEDGLQKGMSFSPTVSLNLKLDIQSIGTNLGPLDNFHLGILMWI